MSPKYSNWHYFKPDTIQYYNRLRTIGPAVLESILDVIETYAECYRKKNQDVRILDAGCGDGRLMVPLLKRSIHLEKDKEFCIFGADLSSLALAKLLEKINEDENLVRSSRWQVYRFDLQKTWPIRSGFLDAIFQFAVFHILEDWKTALAEVDRTLKKKGFFLYIKEINQVFHGSENRLNAADSSDLRKIRCLSTVRRFFEHYHELRREFGLPYIPYGIEYSNIDNLIGFFAEAGYSYKIFRSNKLLWHKPHSFGDIIDAIRFARVTTLGSDLPDGIRTEIADRLEMFCQKSGYRRDEDFEIPARIECHIFQKKT